MPTPRGLVTCPRQRETQSTGSDAGAEPPSTYRRRRSWTSAPKWRCCLFCSCASCWWRSTTPVNSAHDHCAVLHRILWRHLLLPGAFRPEDSLLHLQDSVLRPVAGAWSAGAAAGVPVPPGGGGDVNLAFAQVTALRFGPCRTYSGFSSASACCA